jgi:hypothetical protein
LFLVLTIFCAFFLNISLDLISAKNSGFCEHAHGPILRRNKISLLGGRGCNVLTRKDEIRITKVENKKETYSVFWS